MLLFLFAKFESKLNKVLSQQGNTVLYLFFIFICQLWKFQQLSFRVVEFSQSFVHN